MIADEQHTVQLLEPLIKIIKDRELLYYEALTFATKNIQSSSNDIDQISIFTKFLTTSSIADSDLVIRQTAILNQVSSTQDPPSQGFKTPNTSKQMMRLSARVLEILQSSVEKARGTLFSENGKIGIDFTRFKKALHRTIRQEMIDLSDFASVIINFVKNKYRRQITRIRNYLNRLQAGQNVSLRQMFVKEGSDNSGSPEQKHQRINKSSKHKKLSKDTSPEIESNKRQSTKKVVLHGSLKQKKTLNLKTSKKQDLDSQSLNLRQKEKERRMEKSATAALLLKFYSMMDLNKKQFLEDYVFEKQDQTRQRNRLMTELMEKNIKNALQIKQYCSKCEFFNPNSVPPGISSNYNYSSDENNPTINRNDSSMNSRSSMRTSFVISKRKGSFVFQSGSDRSDIQHHSNLLPLSRTIKNFSEVKKVVVDKKPPQMRPKPVSNSKKIFVIKSPMTFDDEVIPKVEMANVSWVQPPLTGRDKSRRNEHIRLKKRNNPAPLDQKYLPDSFKLHHNQI